MAFIDKAVLRPGARQESTPSISAAAHRRLGRRGSRCSCSCRRHPPAAGQGLPPASCGPATHEQVREMRGREREREKERIYSLTQDRKRQRKQNTAARSTIRVFDQYYPILPILPILTNTFTQHYQCYQYYTIHSRL